MKIRSLFPNVLILGIILVLFAGAAGLQAQCAKDCLKGSCAGACVPGAFRVINLDSHGEEGEHGWLGVVLSQTTRFRKGEKKERKSKEGVTITSVIDGSPASKAGLQEGDVVVKVDDEDVEEVNEFVEYIKGKKPGDEVKLVVLRDGDSKRIKVELGERKGRHHFSLENLVLPHGLGSHAFLAQLGGKPRLGVELTGLTDQLRKYFKVENGLGVLVSKVLEETPAERAGLRAGDVIVAVNGKEVTCASDVRSALSDVEKGERADIEFVRNGSIRTVSAEIDTEKAESDLHRYFKAFPREEMRKELKIIGESKDRVLDILGDYFKEHGELIKEYLDEHKPTLEEYIKSLGEIMEEYGEAIEELGEDYFDGFIEKYREPSSIDIEIIKDGTIISSV